MMSTAENTATEQRDVYARVTSQIINAIENGVSNWRMPWHTSGLSVIKNQSAPSLSIAKTASAAMSLRCHAFITVMETAQMRNGDDPADARNLPRVWTLVVEPQMGPGRVVVTEIPSQGPLQMFRPRRWPHLKRGHLRQTWPSSAAASYLDLAEKVLRSALMGRFV